MNDLSFLFKFAVEYLECGTDYEEKCTPNEVNERENSFLNAFQEICDENTLLDADFKDNIIF